ncbi:MAG: hypothetical protein J4N87_00595 [Chloroflexi bacterium]|nr:hypothetical protein [Chloroflexota bacterium]
MNRQRLASALIAVVLALAAACGGEELLVPTATPKAEAKSVRNIGPQSQALMLRLSSPETNLVTELDRISVTGITAPDATLSVNGRLALPDTEGRFSVDVDLSGVMGPMVIEVVATSVAGETETLVRPVIFLKGPDISGVFGTVTSATPSKLNLQTDSGPVTFSIDSDTAVAVHGWASPTVSDIAQGALVAVMADGPHAESVLAIVGRPVRTRHFTGIVTGLEPGDSIRPGSITLRDGSGLQITAITDNSLDDPTVGEVVTAVLEQDLSSGSLTVTAIDRALTGAQRLYDALALNQEIGSADASANLTALRWRLAEHGVRNLSMLVNGQSFEGSRDAMTNANDTYARFFAEHNIGAPSADVTGLVKSIATSMATEKGPGKSTGSMRLVTIQPESGQAVMVKLSDTTPVALFGERIKSGQLDLASRITVRYTLSGNDANRVTVMAGNTLSADSSTQLAAVAGRGEVQGILMDVKDTGEFITILDLATGQRITLQTGGRSPRAPVYLNGAPVELDSSLEGLSVFAHFDPASQRLLELESLALSPNEETVAGVVHSFIPKMTKGNLTIRTAEGRFRSFTHHAGTAIRRDGLLVSIQDVRIGDLVRPNTRVRTTGEIQVLSLKTPEPGLVAGIIRGVTAGFGGEVRVTVSNIWLDFIGLRVNSETAITQEGRTLGAQDLAVGQEIALASFDPVTLETGVLALARPKDLARASR